MKKKNYYTILGVSRSETTSGIRAAYRKLAKTHHPDLAGNEKTRYFQEINEAYCVLSRPDTRTDYNKSLQEEERQKDEPAREHNVAHRRRTDFGRQGTGLFERDMVGTEDMFDFFFRDFFGAGAHRETAHFLDVEVILTPDEAARGGLLPIPISHACRACRGTGRVLLNRCADCGGRGAIESRRSAQLRIPPNIFDGTVLEVPIYPNQAVLRVVVRIRNLR